MRVYAKGLPDHMYKVGGEQSAKQKTFAGQDLPACRLADRQSAAIPISRHIRIF